MNYVICHFCQKLFEETSINKCEYFDYEMHSKNSREESMRGRIIWVDTEVVTIQKPVCQLCQHKKGVDK